jgi:hypothetical protein
VKVPYVEDKTTAGGLNTPSESDVSRMVRAEVETWQPRRGPDWAEFTARLSKEPAPWVIYSSASVALVFVLFAAFFVLSWLGVGAFAPEPSSLTGH